MSLDKHASPAPREVRGADLMALTGDAHHGDAGQNIYALAKRIFPICRSITGDGVRETLAILRETVPYQISEVPSGTPVFDWSVPKEWNIKDAYVCDPGGRRVIDFRKSNLHVVNYSVPVRAEMPLTELKEHIFTLPDAPDLVPYRTSYYKEFWGFCMAHREFKRLAEGTYTVVIDSSLEDGALTYGEYVHRGDSDEEILLSAHVCHPSLANDNCAGLALVSELARRLQGIKTRYTYRFILAPGTIGAITWLARNEAQVDRIKAGLVLSCIGDRAAPSYKRSRRGTALIDRAVAHVLGHNSPDSSIEDFSPYGYDERQYCSPGFNLPVGLLQRSRFGSFPEYHTSADNLDFISAEQLADSFSLVTEILHVLENDRRTINLSPKCEPQLGRRGLYESIGGDKDAPARNMAMLWVLNLSDGEHSLLDIAERSGIRFSSVAAAAERLEQAELLATV